MYVEAALFSLLSEVNVNYYLIIVIELKSTIITRTNIMSG